MKVQLKWLNEYVKIDDIPLKEFVERMIMTGTNYEGASPIGEGISGVIIGKLEDVRQHPNAEKLKICDVNIGNDTLQILTAAPNVKKGEIVPVAVSGAVIAEGVHIKKGKLRGEESNGMLCSLEELGFSQSLVPKEYQEGILLLDENDNRVLGSDAIKTLGLDSPVVEFEITPNRSDCLSIIGIAHETAATFDLPLNLPKPQSTSQKEVYPVEIQTSLCSRYVATVIEDVQIKQSPIWMQLRLMQAGIRPINNIVDITNYVMLEYGQPLHAFDTDKLRGKIVVREASEGEKTITLDSKERTLEKGDIVIADDSGIIAIAGVMGGENTEITAGTKRVVVESANFNKSSIRKTSKNLGLRSESSSRFEKGVSPHIALTVANRVAQLVTELGVGRVVEGVNDVYPKPVEKVKIPYSSARISSLIGVSLTDDEVESLLLKLGIETVSTDGIKKAIIPYNRLDLTKEIDLVEEVARMYGYDNIPLTINPSPVAAQLTKRQKVRRAAKNELLSLGVSEVLSYSFVSDAHLDKVRPGDETRIRIINPLGVEFSVMRTTLLPNMIEIVERNVNRKNEELKFFEIGNVFFPSKSSNPDDEPLEKEELVIALTGKNEDFFTLKGVVEGLLARLRIEEITFVKYKEDAKYHPGKCAKIFAGDVQIGIIGEIHPEKVDIDQRLYVAELDFEKMIDISLGEYLFSPIPKFPAIERDLAILVKDEITAYEIEQVIKEASGTLLESAELFDIYKGMQIASGYKSMAYALKYRGQKNLTDEEVNRVFNKMLKELENKLGATLR